MASTDAALALNPWWAIWWRPQATIKAIAAREPWILNLVIGALAGAALVLMAGFSADMPRAVLLLTALICGPLLAVFSLYVSGTVMAWVGWALAGKASLGAVRTAIAWSLVPLAAVFPIILGVMLAVGTLKPNADAAQMGLPAILAILGVSLLAIAASLWSTFLTVRTIGAVQGFGFLRSVVWALLSALLLLGAAQAQRTFGFHPFNIPAASMEPTLLVGDYILVNKSSYGWSRYSFPFDTGSAGRVMGAAQQRGDLAIFRLPSDPRTDYVKRVIGLPGDEIRMVNGVLHINGAAVPKRPAGEYESDFLGRVPVYEEELPNGVKYRVLDSEENGPFDNVGPYTVPDEHYFVLGDNRDNSTDSRASWGVGYVPYENFVGRVSAIYFSFDMSSVRWARIFTIPR